MTGLARPVDGASLAAFRIAFGVIMLAEIGRYLANGWVEALFEAPRYLLGWSLVHVPPWPGRGMHLHFVALGVLAICVSLGLFYRAAATALFLGFAYVLLLDASHTLELNHLYLMALLAFLLACMPAANVWSVTRQMARPVPFWCIFLLRAQVACVYFFAGVAKCHADWIAGFHPMTEMLARQGVTTPGAAMALSWGGLVFDLAIVPLLLMRRTRGVALALAVAFHAMNAHFFSIGVFPALAVAATTLFLDPGWPRRLLPARPARTDAAPTPALAATDRRVAAVSTVPRWIYAYLAVQAVLPLRAYLYPGDPGWTEQGNYFAWRMMMYEKNPGPLGIFVFDPVSMRTEPYDPAIELTPLQIRSLATRPELLRLYAHHVADVMTPLVGTRPEVRMRAVATFNGRPPALLVDPERDLAAVEFELGPSDWIKGG